MTERITKEMEILRSIFPDVEYHEVDTGWIRVPRYTVQHGSWSQKEVAVCFLVLGGYPGNPPYAFWVSPPLRLAAGAGPQSTTTRSRPRRRSPARGVGSPGLTSTSGAPGPSRRGAATSSTSYCRSATGSRRGPDMKISLDLSRGLKKRFWAHLLQNELEQAAFLFARRRRRRLDSVQDARGVPGPARGFRVPDWLSLRARRRRPGRGHQARLRHGDRARRVPLASRQHSAGDLFRERLGRLRRIRAA